MLFCFMYLRTGMKRTTTGFLKLGGRVLLAWLQLAVLLKSYAILQAVVYQI